MGKAVPPLLGEGLRVRQIVVRSSDVLLVRAHLEASEGLGNLFAEQGGELMLATTEEQLPELDRFIEDLAAEMPMWGPDAPRAR
jgi:hypothetical protein